MKGLELTIYFEGDKAFIPHGKSLSLRQLGIPDHIKRFKSPASWKIRVLNFHPSEHRIVAEILSFNSIAGQALSLQPALREQLEKIESITFLSIDTPGLLLSVNGTGSSRVYVTERSKVNTSGEPAYAFPATAAPAVQEVRGDVQRVASGIPSVIRDSFTFPIKSLKFRLGGVAFDQWIPQLNRHLEITIPNYDVREEFDAVKNYFAHALQTKKIRVRLVIHTGNGEVTSVEASSPEIDRINASLIDTVRFEWVKTMRSNKQVPGIDKSLFSMDELFESMGEKQAAAHALFGNEKQLAEDLLQIADSMHYRHLRYLSDRHCHSIMKLRFVLKPFSFIFLIEGKKNYHIIWETLDTREATYIWHEDKDLQKLRLTLQKIEDIIHVVKVQGKTAYINTGDDRFRRIYHDYSEIVDGFVKWKGELDSILA